MTGIERLRTLAAARDEWILGGTLADIADQIERERECERDTIENLRLELGEARDDAAWVREHGGMDYVKSEWRSRVPHDRYEARRQRLIDHIAECETALGRRRERIEELEGLLKTFTNENAELRRRAMPEGCEWPTVDGRKVDFKTPYQPSLGVLEAVSIYSNGACEVMSHDGIIKQVSEIHIVVPAADGEPLEVGQTVWDTNGDELVIGAIEDGGHTVTCRYADVGDGIPVHGMWSPSDLTHQRPVFDADGVPIKVGDTVYFTDGREQECNTVVHAKYDYKDEPYVQFGRLNEAGYPTYTNCSCIDPSQLTHTKPEPPDSWERIEEDAGCTATKYNERRGTIFTTKQQVARDLIRRCRALAERERGE